MNDKTIKQNTIRQKVQKISKISSKWSNFGQIFRSRESSILETLNGDSKNMNISGIPFLLWFNINTLMVTWYKAKHNKSFQMTI
jgi:hypothetical protein